MKPVLVTTADRGVFFGYTTDAPESKTITLRRARCCVYWENTKGFLGLTVEGPNDRCRIGPAVDMTLQDVTSVTQVTAAAAAAMERAPWRF